MRALTMVRKVDELGRIVLPMELRRMFDISDRDAMEIFVEDDKIILKKYEPACMFCHHTDGIMIFEGKNICKNCVKNINKASQAAQEK